MKAFDRFPSGLSNLGKHKQKTAQRFNDLLSRTQSLYAASPHGENAKPCALRISNGLHQGAALRFKDAIRLGSAPDNDLVLQDPGVRPHHAELRRVDGMWGLYDVENGRPLHAIEVARRGKFERRRHGLGAAELVFSQIKKRRGPITVRPSNPKRSLAVLLLVFSVFLIGVTAYVGHKVIFPEPVGETRNLVRDGFPDVKLTVGRNQQSLLSGYVDNAEALGRLKRWIDLQVGLGAPQVKVRVGDELANRVREALQDTDLTVQYVSGGVVRVLGTTNKLDVREQIGRLAADLRGIVRIDDKVSYLEAVEEVKPPPPYKIPVRVVDVIPGKQGSFGDGRGTRYFVGAILPDGAEVLNIELDAIEVTLSGTKQKYFIQGY